ncbi:STAS domain-containing protein [Streptomyces sp. NPDC007907]|uniref:STAS domain-containing protein n=1 Tax=Streptomyces sp. NPDC007907 TaxID=3364789 RepID=UPI0036E2F100
MTAELHPVQPPVKITVVDGHLAEVTLTGDISVPLLRDLEACLADARLREVERWVLDMHAVTRIELACAYALLRAVTEHSGTATVHGARRTVLRTLRDAGLDKAAVIGE